MQNKVLTREQLVMTIKTDRVYDWVVSESSFDLTLVNKTLPAGVELNDDNIDEITVDIEPRAVEPATILSSKKRTFIIGENEVHLHVYQLRKHFIAYLSFPTVHGVVKLEVPFSRNEKVVLHAPQFTTIDLTYTNINSYISSFTVEGSTFHATISVHVCESIQTIYPVTVDIVAYFNGPRTSLPVQPCPTPPQPPVRPYMSRKPN